MFVLDNKREIILRPNSVKQIDAWIDWFLIQGSVNIDTHAFGVFCIFCRGLNHLNGFGLFVFYPIGVGLNPHLWGSIVGNSQSFQRFIHHIISGLMDKIVPKNL